MEAYALEWVQLLIRWVHLITGIAWIGSSFYFVMLDNSLLPPKRKQDADERDERESLLDLYMRAMETAPAEKVAKAA